jgi:uncharacterized membrane protein
MSGTEDLIAKWGRQRVRHQHRHPPVANINRLHAESSGAGARLADRLANIMGSWRFILIQSALLLVWLALNIVAYIQHWDPYPFILLNLALSFQAAYAAPIIMMSQNRQAEKDRMAAEHDYLINEKAEEEVKAIMHHLEQQDELMIDILNRLGQQHQVLLNRIGPPGALAAAPAEASGDKPK